MAGKNNKDVQVRRILFLEAAEAVTKAGDGEVDMNKFKYFNMVNARRLPNPSEELENAINTAKKIEEMGALDIFVRLVKGE